MGEFDHKVVSLDKGRYQLTCHLPFPLRSGAQLHQMQCVFETYGTLSTARDNVILVHHALSSGSHVASHSLDSTPGWWENMVGPDRPLDTNHYFVICINNLGSCNGSSGPTSIDPTTQRPYQANFPVIHIEDMVKAQCVVLDALNIKTCHTVIGPSMGGMLSLSMAITHPKRIQRLALIASTGKAYPANIALRSIQREVIRLDPAWKNGFYTEKFLSGFFLARQLGYMTYRNHDDLNKRFATRDGDAQDCIKQYLDYNAKKFVTCFDANSYLTLLSAMDKFNPFVAENPLSVIQAKVNIISIDSDILFPPIQQKALFLDMKKAGVDVDLREHKSNYGHDAFLVETDKFGKHLTALLTQQSGRNTSSYQGISRFKFFRPPPTILPYHVIARRMFAPPDLARKVIQVGMRKL